MRRSLVDLELDRIPRLMVLNKMDRAEPDELENRRRTYGAIAISAIDKSTLGPLAEELARHVVPPLDGIAHA